MAHQLRRAGGQRADRGEEALGCPARTQVGIADEVVGRPHAARTQQRAHLRVERAHREPLRPRHTDERSEQRGAGVVMLVAVEVRRQRTTQLGEARDLAQELRFGLRL